jgi:sugar transferase (PEP-CTERM system associated)
VGAQDGWDNCSASWRFRRRCWRKERIVIRIFHHYVSKIAFMLLLLEVLILLTAAVASAPLWLKGRPGGAEQLYLPALAFALVVVFSMGTLGMYQHNQSREDIKSTLLRILPSFVLGFLLMNLLANMLPGAQFGRLGSMVFVLGGASVLLARLVVFTSAQSSMLEQRLIIIGDGAIARECLELAASSVGFHQFRVVGFVPVAGEVPSVPPAMLLPPDLPLLALARRYAADEIVVTVGDRRNGAFPVRQLLECALGGVPVTDAASFFEREACQIRVDSLQPSYLIFGGGFDQSLLRATVKRAFDLLASLAIGVAAIPVMLLTAMAIRIEDGGPVFYQQERVGRDNRVFKVLKFRSMRQDAELDGKPKWATADDPRVTLIGHWIRKLRIDELPQMLNVFRGEMSFVGPRPERAYFVEQLCEQIAYYNVRHGIKPGITGLAQVRYRYGASVDDAVRNLLAALVDKPAAVNQVYNVALNARTSLNELYLMLHGLLVERHPHLRDYQPQYGEFRAGDVRHSQADIAKAANLLGYAPTHDLQRGLGQALRWYESHLAARPARS